MVTSGHPTDEEASVARLLQAARKCGALGWPTYPDGHRWRTWCQREAGHVGAHAHSVQLLGEWHGQSGKQGT